MRVGSLVILNVHSHFTNGIKDVIGIPFNEVGIVLDYRCGVCTVIFPALSGKITSLIEQDLEIISEVK